MKTLSLLFILLALLLNACSPVHIRKGDAAYENMAFKKATKHYEKALNAKNSTVIHKKLAETYLRMNDSKKAAEHSKMALSSDEASSDAKPPYAQMLIASDDQTGDMQWLREYLEETPNEIPTQTTGDFSMYDATHIVEVIRVDGFSGVFSAYPTSDGIYFVGEKKTIKGNKKNPWNGHSFLDVYHATEVTKTEWVTPRAIKGEMNKTLHDGPLSITANGQIAYLTRSAMDKGGQRKLDEKCFNQLKIVKLNLDNSGEWKLMSDLPLNQPNSSSMHPNICSDENTLFFASDREGGYGGIDLYMTVYDGQKWTEPVNLGSEINTAQNEVFPFAQHKDTLFFASDGHSGLGGLDIFISIFDGQKWSSPQNMKDPINTSSDDFALYRYEGGTGGYLSSNRNGTDEIFSWRTEAAPSLQDQNANTLAFTINKVNPRERNPNLQENEEFWGHGLASIELEKAYVLNNIYFDYNKYVLHKAAVGDLENLLAFMQHNPSTKIELSAHTDARGTTKHNHSLSEKRARAAVNYLIANNIEKGRLIYKGYGESMPVNECTDGVECSEEKHQENRRLEFRVLK